MATLSTFKAFCFLRTIVSIMIKVATYITRLLPWLLSTVYCPMPYLTATVARLPLLLGRIKIPRATKQFAHSKTFFSILKPHFC